MNPRPRYLQIPLAVICNPNLQPLDFQVYGVVHWYRHMSKQQCTASNETIAGILSCGERKVNPKSVSNSVSRLEKARCVDVLLKPNNKRIEIIPLVKDEPSPAQERVDDFVPSTDGSPIEKTVPLNDGREVDDTLDVPSNDGREIEVAPSDNGTDEVSENLVPSNDAALFHQMMPAVPSNDGQKKNTEQEDIEKENNNSSYEELQRLTAEVFGDEVHVEKKLENSDTLQEILPRPELLEGEVAELPNSKPKKPRREKNPDGSFGNPEVNEVRVYFLKTMGIESEDCSRQESGIWWWNLLNSVKGGLNKVDTVKALIDLAKADRIYCTITTPKKLYYKRNELMLRLQNKLNGGVRIGVVEDTPIDQDRPNGVKIGVYYANQ